VPEREDARQVGGRSGLGHANLFLCSWTVGGTVSPFTVDMEAKNVGASGAPWLSESSSGGARVVNLALEDKRKLAFCPTDCSTSCHAL